MSSARRNERGSGRRGEGRKGGKDVPADLAGFEMELRGSERRETAEILKGGRTPLKVIEVADRATALAEQAVARVKEKYPPPPLACQEGCDWCCYLTVGTNVPEVVRIVEYLRQALSPEEFAALRERVARLAGQKRAGAAGPLPCALLVERRCIAYPVRPLTCRGFNSRDARECERAVKSRSKAGVPMYVPEQRLTTFALDGAIAGLAEAGLSAQLLELTAALRIALDEPDALARWLAGGPAFAPAQMP